MMNEDWIECELGDLLILSNAKHTPVTITNIFYIGLEHIGKSTGSLTESVGIAEITTVKNKFSKGQILYGKLRPYFNKVYLAKEDGVCSTDILVFSVNEDIEDKYATYYMLSRQFVNDMSENTSGVNLPRVSTQYVISYKFPLAPLPIQRAIVSKIEALFSDLDNGIANFKKAQAQLKIYRQAVLKKAFEGELTKEWREKNNISFNWEKTTTGEVMTNINSGSTPKAEFLSTSGEIQFLKVYNLNFDGTLNHQKDPAYTTFEIHSTSNKRAICIAGDVLINIVGPPLGKVSVIPENSKLEFNINQAIVRFRPNEKIISKFLSLFLQSPTIINWLEGTSKATAGQYNVKVSTCREIPISLPSMVEQTQIVQEIESRLSVCDKVEQSITESIAKAEALRQSILKKAFEGKLLSPAEIDLCKKEADYEPASVLLEKIKAEKSAKEQAQKKPISKIKK
jgi:type I restriction enzyme S subunit